MSELNVLQIGSQDLIGRRFNGQDLNRNFNSRGIPSHHLVWTKSGDDPDTSLIFNFPGRRTMAKIVEHLENSLSIRCWLQIWTFALVRSKYFKRAKTIHFHLLHWPSYFSLWALPLLTKSKAKTVWTIHDCWAFTGHCVYPFDCTRWQTGCGKCPYLKTPFKMKRDLTRLAWKVKRYIYSISKFEVIVASRFMEQMVRQSPLLQEKTIHLVPFGLDLNVFSPGDSAVAKAAFGIDPNVIVIAFRSAPGEFKGFDNILAALRLLQTEKPVCLLTFNDPGKMQEFENRFQIVDLGWLDDEEVTVAAYRAADFFLMPSTQEAFGLMAIEAMACGKPVVVFSGTSLPEIINGEDCGIVVPQGDNSGLAAAAKTLIENVQLREAKGKAARTYAEAHYDFRDHVARLEKIYEV